MKTNGIHLLTYPPLLDKQQRGIARIGRVRKPFFISWSVAFSQPRFKSLIEKCPPLSTPYAQTETFLEAKVRCMTFSGQCGKRDPAYVWRKEF